MKTKTILVYALNGTGFNLTDTHLRSATIYVAIAMEIK